MVRVTALVTVLGATAACNQDSAKQTVQPPQTEAATVEEPTDGPAAALDGPVAMVPAVKLPSAPGPAVPGNLELDRDEAFFQLDTTTTEVELPVHGDAASRFAGRLRSTDGRRELVLTRRNVEEVVFAVDWWLPGVAAVSDNGDVLACANRLAGEAATRLSGTMPDPRFGVDLVCRIRTSNGWQPKRILPRQEGAHWLINLTPRRDGLFWVIYSIDRSGLMLSDPEPGDAVHRIPFANGNFGTSKAAYEFPLPPDQR
jgi:hypothetical protein